MRNFVKIATGLGVLAGISYFGKNRMEREKTVAKAGGFVGYVKGMGQGFIYGARSILRLR